MAYKLFEETSVVKDVANILFYDTADFWMGYHSHEEILDIINEISSSFLSLAEELVNAVKDYNIKHYFEEWGRHAPDNDLIALSQIGKWDGEQVSIEEFLSMYGPAYTVFSKLWRLAVVAGICIIEHAEKYLELAQDEAEEEEE
ncbi:MAG: hypothetical protein QXW98_04250 [Candidatus Caldarchaeum sp.]